MLKLLEYDMPHFYNMKPFFFFFCHGKKCNHFFVILSLIMKNKMIFIIGFLK